jgi:Xaa-Pro aminopeptidase
MLNAAATRIITEGLVDLGIIKSNGKSIDELITQGAYRPFYMHSLGHPVGLDVHDVGTGDKNQAFKPGMVITIEPGIYIKNDIPGVDPKWLNIGVRVEDTSLDIHLVIYQRKALKSTSILIPISQDPPLYWLRPQPQLVLGLV